MRYRQCLGAAVAFVVLGVGSGSAGSPASADGGDVVVGETGRGVDAGVVHFEFTPARQEWSVGTGKTVGVPRWRMSFVGSGFSVSRPDRSGDVLARPQGLRDLELQPWVGGCIDCVIGGGTSVGFEAKWAPETFSLGAASRGEEGRAAVSLRFRW